MIDEIVKILRDTYGTYHQPNPEGIAQKIKDLNKFIPYPVNKPSEEGVYIVRLKKIGKRSITKGIETYPWNNNYDMVDAWKDVIAFKPIPVEEYVEDVPTKEELLNLVDWVMKEEGHTGRTKKLAHYIKSKIEVGEPII